VSGLSSSKKILKQLSKLPSFNIIPYFFKKIKILILYKKKRPDKQSGRRLIRPGSLGKKTRQRESGELNDLIII